MGRPKKHSEPETATERVLTVGGKPIPAHLYHLIPYGVTDQGRAEADARVEYRASAQISVGAEPYNKSMDRYEFEEEALSPAQNVIAQAQAAGLLPPGMHPRMLSSRHTGEMDRRGYKVVKDANGNAIMSGKMVLGMMPEHLVQRHRDRKHALANDPLKEVHATANETLKEIAREAGMSDRNVALEANRTLVDSRDPAHAAAIGFSFGRE